MSAWRHDKPDTGKQILAYTTYGDRLVCELADDGTILTSCRMYNGRSWDGNILRWCYLSEVEELIEYGILIDPVNPDGDGWTGD